MRNWGWTQQRCARGLDTRPAKRRRGLTAVRRAWPDFEPTRHTSATQRRRCGGRRRDRRAWPRCWWAAAGPGRASSRRAERSSWRGRLAGGPPPTSTHSGPARRRPEHQRGNKHHKQPRNANARQPARAAARSRNYFALDTVERPATQRSRAATTSATWTAFRAAPLRRLSPETTRMRPRLPSTA